MTVFTMPASAEGLKSPADQKRERIRLDPTDRDKFYRDMDREGLELIEQANPFQRNANRRHI